MGRPWCFLPLIGMLCSLGGRQLWHCPFLPLLLARRPRRLQLPVEGPLACCAGSACCGSLVLSKILPVVAMSSQVGVRHSGCTVAVPPAVHACRLDAVCLAACMSDGRTVHLTGSSVHPIGMHLHHEHGLKQESCHNLVAAHDRVTWSRCVSSMLMSKRCRGRDGCRGRRHGEKRCMETGCCQRSGHAGVLYRCGCAFVVCMNVCGYACTYRMYLQVYTCI